MEKFELTIGAPKLIEDYLVENHVMPYEKELLTEILSGISKNDANKLKWFTGFGSSLRQVLMNVNEYRKALTFGFSEISFNQYGWVNTPKFLDFEKITVHLSSIRIGRGPNGHWAYALSCSYGTAGSSGPLSVFCKKFSGRDIALQAALTDMKTAMTRYLGDPDTTNYKQDVLKATIAAIVRMEISMVQLTLF